MSKTAAIAAFVVGAAAGSVATWFLVKKKYEQIAQEEIDSVKEVLLKRHGSDEAEGEPDTAEPEEAVGKSTKLKPNIMEYANNLRKQGYTNYSETDKLEMEDDDEDAPHVISPEEFGEHGDEYETYSFTYYADQVLVDEAHHIVEDVEGTVGFDSLNHFGEYEDDSVFVRNNRKMCEYEILYDPRTYADVIEKEPYKAEV